PPIFTPAAAAVPTGGYVLVCGVNSLTATRTHSRTRANKETWVYDVAANQWRPAGGDLDLYQYDWLTAAPSQRHGVVLMVALGPERRTYAFRYDPSGPAIKRTGAPPDTVRWKFPDQKGPLETAPRPDVAAQKTFLAQLPVNRFVNANPPATVVSKTWSSAICDTDRGVVIYTGGGHSGYSGNDFAHYSVAENRWSLSWPPCFPPFLEATNASVFGLSYACRPWSQHTYLWYAYDPVSRMVLYCARPTLKDNLEMQLDPDPTKTFVHTYKKTGYWTWVYDPAKRRLCPPSFGRPFGNPWHLALCGTPRGVYALAQGVLYLATVADGMVTWKVVDDKGPTGKRDYNYEWQPIVYDSKRERLLHVMGKDSLVEVHARSLAEGAKWHKIETTGSAQLGREVVYLPRTDSLLMLGRGTLCVMDCATNEWRQLDVEMPKGSYGTECAMVYDPVHDVCVALIPSAFSGPMQTFLFRYDPKSAKSKVSQ
ncbi:MAG: hypothetical protein AMS14_06655, partial [Planctomycetes bacterium DG_20]